jgi:hypothetical protein
MMMKKGLRKITLSAIFLLVLSALPISAAETKVEGRIYSNWMLNTSDEADGYNSFLLDRSYITAKSKLSDYTNVVITMDMRSVDSYKGYTMILKYGYAAWKPKFAYDYMTVTLGLQPTKYLEAVDGSFWGRRYVSSSTGDINSYLSTADLGLTISTNLGKQGMYGSAGLSVWNGTKYSDVVEKNKQKDFNPYIVFKPVPNNPDFDQTILAAQFYSGTQNIAFGDSLEASDYKHQIMSIGGKLAYSNNFDLGFDFNWNTLGQGNGENDKKQSAFSGFGTLYLAKLAGENSILKTLGLFGRFDMVDPNTDANDDGKNIIIAGVECTPVKGVAASINIRSTDYQETDKANEKALYLNTEFKF